VYVCAIPFGAHMCMFWPLAGPTDPSSVFLGVLSVLARVPRRGKSCACPSIIPQRSAARPSQVGRSPFQYERTPRHALRDTPNKSARNQSPKQGRNKRRRRLKNDILIHFGFEPACNVVQWFHSSLGWCTFDSLFD